MTKHGAGRRKQISRSYSWVAPKGMQREMGARRSTHAQAALLFVLVFVLFVLAHSPAAAENEVFRVSGEPLRGALSIHKGAWSVGGARVAPTEVLFVRFSAVAAPLRIPAGIFVRGGSLLCGNLVTLKGATASVSATSLGRVLELKTADFAGAFFPLSAEVPENFSALGSYPQVLAALERGAADAPGTDREDRDTLRPGGRDRVTLMTRDELEGKVVKLGAELAVIDRPRQKGLVDPPPARQALRLIENAVEAPPSPTREEQELGLEVAVRLVAGDLLRGRVSKLDEKNLLLATPYAGLLTLPRETLVALYPAGAPGGGLTWLSALKPSSNLQTPLFDAQFPMRLNLSCEKNLLRLGGMECDRGLGVHARSELTYALEGKPGRKFVALVGIDDETRGRGLAEAQVLADGKVVWNSGPLAPNAAPKTVCADLGAARELKLRVDYGSDEDDSGDHVDWGWAALVGP